MCVTIPSVTFYTHENKKALRKQYLQAPTHTDGLDESDSKLDVAVLLEVSLATGENEQPRDLVVVGGATLRGTGR